MPRLNKYPFYLIHRAIRASKHLCAAAAELKVNHTTLARYVGRITYKGSPLTYARLKTLSVGELRRAWGVEVYDAPLEARSVSLANYPFEKIHAIIIASKTLNGAATKLGVDDGTLGLYIGKITYDGSPLTYERLKTVSVGELRGAWGVEVYDKPLKIRWTSLGDYPFAKIHATIIASKNLRGAATKLGVDDGTLGLYIGKITYDGSPLTCARLKALSADKLREAWGAEVYDKPKNSVGGGGALEKAALKPEGMDMEGEPDSDSVEGKPDYWKDYMGRPAAFLTPDDAKAFMPDETSSLSTDTGVSLGGEETLNPWDEYMARKGRFFKALSPSLSNTTLSPAVAGAKRTRAATENPVHGAVAATRFESPSPPPPREKRGRHTSLFSLASPIPGAGDGPLLPCKDLGAMAVMPPR